MLRRCGPITLLFLLGLLPPKDLLTCQERPQERVEIVARVLEVVMDSLPVVAGEGAVEVTQFVIDPDKFLTIQSRIQPNWDWSLTTEIMLRAMAKAEATGFGSFELEAQSKVLDCVGGIGRDCEMDPSTALLTIGGIRQIDRDRVQVAVSTEFVPSFGKNLHHLTHIVTLRFDGREWILSDYDLEVG